MTPIFGVQKIRGCKKRWIQGNFGRNYHSLSENHNFSGTEPPLELKPVCNLEFVRCGLVEKKLRDVLQERKGATF